MANITNQPPGGLIPGQGSAPQEEEYRRPRKKKVFKEEKPSVSLNSLMDILTILMIFFLKNYSADPTKITEGSDLKLAHSNSKLKPEDAVPIAVTRTAILVNDKPVVAIMDGKIDASFKRGGATGYFINPLYDALEAERQKQERIARFNQNQSFKGLATLIGDKSTPFRLLTEVMYTAGQAQFANFKFAAIKK